MKVTHIFGASHESTDHRRCNADACRRTCELEKLDRCHLGEIGEAGDVANGGTVGQAIAGPFTTIVLKVGVCSEANHLHERQVCVESRKTLRVERKATLEDEDCECERHLENIDE